jgi:tetratricopeptide (TPR) repeat protein
LGALTASVDDSDQPEAGNPESANQASTPTTPRHIRIAATRSRFLGRKAEARADLQKAVALKDNAPMRNRVGWAYFNMGDYADALREFEAAAKSSNHKSHYDYYSLVLGYWGMGDMKRALENYQLAVERDPRFGEYRTLNERTIEWTPLERRAMHETYVLWSKAWKP